MSFKYMIIDSEFLLILKIEAHSIPKFEAHSINLFLIFFYHR